MKQFQIKIKRHLKRPMILLEVLIALALISLCMIPLISPHVTLIQQQKRFVTTMEMDRVVNLMYVDVLERLQKNEIPWRAIQEKQALPIDDIVERIQEKKIPLTGSFQFGEVHHKENDTTGWHVYELSITFTIFPKNASKPLVFPFTVPVIRHVVTNDTPQDDVNDEENVKPKDSDEDVDESKEAGTKSRKSSKSAAIEQIREKNNKTKESRK